jgi:hypothetical protein
MAARDLRQIEMFQILAHENQPAGLGIGQWMKQHRIDG